MVGHIGASATASIGIVSSSTWLLHGNAGRGCICPLPFRWHSIWVPTGRRMPGACCGSPCCSILVVGLPLPPSAWASAGFCPVAGRRRGTAGKCFGVFLPSGRLPCPLSWLWGTYSAMLRSTGDALTPGLISVLTCVLDVIFNFSSSIPPGDDGIWPQNDRLGPWLGRAGRGAGHSPCQRCGRYCWRWASCYCGTARFASANPARGALPAPACITCGRWVHRWRQSAPLCPSAQVLLVRIVSGLGTTAIAANSLGVSAEACATWQAMAFRMHPLHWWDRPWAQTVGIWQKTLPGCAPAWA